MNSAIGGKPAVFFDFGHTGVFGKGDIKSLRLRTIISVHSFEEKDRLNHQFLHKRQGIIIIIIFSVIIFIYSLIAMY